MVTICVALVFEVETVFVSLEHRLVITILNRLWFVVFGKGLGTSMVMKMSESRARKSFKWRFLVSLAGLCAHFQQSSTVLNTSLGKWGQYTSRRMV